MTLSQILAVLNLLIAFNVPQATVLNVQAILTAPQAQAVVQMPAPVPETKPYITPDAPGTGNTLPDGSVRANYSFSGN